MPEQLSGAKLGNNKSAEKRWDPKKYTATRISYNLPNAIACSFNRGREKALISGATGFEETLDFYAKRFFENSTDA